MSWNTQDYGATGHIQLPPPEAGDTMGYQQDSAMDRSGDPAFDAICRQIKVRIDKIRSGASRLQIAMNMIRSVNDGAELRHYIVELSQTTNKDVCEAMKLLQQSKKMTKNRRISLEIRDKLKMEFLELSSNLTTLESQYKVAAESIPLPDQRPVEDDRGRYIADVYEQSGEDTPLIQPEPEPWIVVGQEPGMVQGQEPVIIQEQHQDVQDITPELLHQRALAAEQIYLESEEISSLQRELRHFVSEEGVKFDPIESEVSRSHSYVERGRSELERWAARKRAERDIVCCCCSVDTLAKCPCCPNSLLTCCGRYRGIVAAILAAIFITGVLLIIIFVL